MHYFKPEGRLERGPGRALLRGGRDLLFKSIVVEAGARRTGADPSPGSDVQPLVDAIGVDNTRLL